jgi:hypothetical protein
MKITKYKHIETSLDDEQHEEVIAETTEVMSLGFTPPAKRYKSTSLLVCHLEMISKKKY